MANKATERQARYDATHTKQIKLKLNTETDADVLAWLDSQDSMQGAIKRLIRAEIERMADGKILEGFLERCVGALEQDLARDGHESGHGGQKMA